MSFLNALNYQGSQRTKILSQAHAGRDLAQLAAARIPHQCEALLVNWIFFNRPSDSAHGYWNFYMSFENAVAISLNNFEISQWLVDSRPACVGVAGGLFRPPVLSSRQEKCINAIHNPFVVGGGTMDIPLGEFLGLNDFVCELYSLPHHLVQRNLEGRVGQALAAVVCQYPQTYSQMKLVLDQLAKLLAQSVKQIGSHSFADVYKDLDDRHVLGLGRGRQSFNSDRVEPSPSSKHVLKTLSGQQPDFRLDRLKLIRKCLQRVAGYNLNLADHNIVGGVSPKAATISNELGGRTGGRYHRRLLDRHGHEHRLVVYHESC